MLGCPPQKLNKDYGPLPCSLAAPHCRALPQALSNPSFSQDLHEASPTADNDGNLHVACPQMAVDQSWGDLVRQNHPKSIRD